MTALKERLSRAHWPVWNQALKRAFPFWEPSVMKSQAPKDWETLELKQRVQALTLLIRAQVTPSRENIKRFPLAVACFPSNAGVGLTGFWVWPLTQYIHDYGLTEFATSMESLKGLTPAFTSEFGIRAFLEKDPEQSLVFLKKWVTDTDPHVRRLVSEGSRPLLPWSYKLSQWGQNPQWMTPLLITLGQDVSPYVRTSVGNHWNDFSKLNSSWVLRHLPKNTEPALTQKALRTLIKKGDPKALARIGVCPTPFVLSHWKLHSSQLKLGDTLSFEAQIQNKSAETRLFVVDWELALRGKNGAWRYKVFKGRKWELPANGKKLFQGQVGIKKITTRRYYTGPQMCRLLVNGEPSAWLNFDLVVPKTKMKNQDENKNENKNEKLKRK